MAVARVARVIYVSTLVPACTSARVAPTRTAMGWLLALDAVDVRRTATLWLAEATPMLLAVCVTLATCLEMVSRACGCHVHPIARALEAVDRAVVLLVSMASDLFSTAHRTLTAPTAALLVRRMRRRHPMDLHRCLTALARVDTVGRYRRPRTPAQLLHVLRTARAQVQVRRVHVWSTLRASSNGVPPTMPTAESVWRCAWSRLQSRSRSARTQGTSCCL